MSNYFGITIGPISRFLGTARRLRELWFCSYSFSYIMKSICEGIHVKYGSEATFLLPDFKILTDGSVKGVGTFPDRIIFTANENIELDEIRSIISSALENYADQIQVPSSISNVEALEFATQFFRINAVKVNSTVRNEVVADSSDNYMTSVLIDLLNQLDMENSIVEIDENCFIQKLFKKLTDSAFFKVEYQIQPSDRFPSLLAVATAEIINQYSEIDKLELTRQYFFGSDDRDAEFFEEIKKKVPLKVHHKYVAIVSADADGVGKHIKGLSSNDRLEFSAAMLKWSENAILQLKKYSAVPIYSGGDDLLFAAPIVMNEVDILELCSKIQEDFKRIVNPEHNKDLGLSFGICIFYYKFPLAEAMHDAGELLEQLKRNKQVNHFNIRVRKHAGTAFRFAISPNTELYDNYKKAKEFTTADNLLNSFIYNLREFKELHEYLGIDATRRKYFFSNTIEEFASNGYLENAASLLESQVAAQKGNMLEAIERTYDVLRFTKFIKGLDEYDN